MIDHVPVPGLHASLIVFRGQNDPFIRPFCNMPVYGPVFSAPAFRLILAGDHQNQPDVRMVFAIFQDLERRQRVKAQRPAAHESAVPPRISESTMASIRAGLQ